MKNDLLKIISHYGVKPQLKYFQSEVFEFNEAVIKYEFASDDNKEWESIEKLKKWNLSDFKKDIIEEMADVLVMLFQFKEYYQIDKDEILKIMKEKIDRQLKRIEEEK